MRMTFSQDGDSVIFVGDLLNIHGDALDRIFGTVFHSIVGCHIQLLHLISEVTASLPPWQSHN